MVFFYQHLCNKQFLSEKIIYLICKKVNYLEKLSILSGLTGKWNKRKHSLTDLDHNLIIPDHVNLCNKTHIETVWDKGPTSQQRIFQAIKYCP